MILTLSDLKIAITFYSCLIIFWVSWAILAEAGLTDLLGQLMAARSKKHFSLLGLALAKESQNFNM